MRKVCVVIGSRANYSSIKSVMRAVREHPDLQLQLVVGASALLDRFGSVVDVIERDGFAADARVNMIVEGETPVTMAKSTGLGLLELPTMFEMLKPDVVVTVGDRFETMATAVASAYMNIPLAHTMGGEVTGTIDESIRHAVTKLAHIHFPANREAGDRIIRIGEAPETVHVVGCPRIDLVAEMVGNGGAALDAEWLEREGVGGHISIDAAVPAGQPASGDDRVRLRRAADPCETLEALHELQMPTIMLWPNVDAGSEDIVARHAQVPRAVKPEYIRFYKNFPVETYVRLMKSAACLVGNSSASSARARSSARPRSTSARGRAGATAGRTSSTSSPRPAPFSTRCAGSWRTGRTSRPTSTATAPRAANRRRAGDDAVARAETHSDTRCTSSASSRRAAARRGSRARISRCWQDGRCSPTPAMRRAAAGWLTRVIVSTDDAEIAEVAQHCGIEVPFLRPAALAADETPMLDVLLDLIATLDAREGYRPDVLVLLQPTSPLRRAAHIDAAVALLEASAPTRW